MEPNRSFNHRKYRPHRPFAKPDRKWPDRTLTSAPTWCSVDLRDGNQALIEPMTPEQKMEMFQLLLDVGFKEIEVGFPAASSPDFQFVRQLIEGHHIPNDVTIQILTPARDTLIEKSFEALRGARQAIVHLYNSTSTIQREEVFCMSKDEVRELAIRGAQKIVREARKQPDTNWLFQYSPESFTSTEMDYALSVCNAVIDVFEPSEEKPMVINLPATVEVSSPHVYADQIEWMSERLHRRSAVRLSLHTHNDRGSGVAAAELGVLAGADRVEGTMLGNGERTGNMCIVTMAMNLYSQGINPGLYLADMDRIRSTVERSTQLAVHPRHPYAGDLVYAAFSGSHQDAINKCLKKDAERRQKSPECAWQVAYLPIDPTDLGRSYQEVVRVNSQSGKGGMAFILEQEYQLRLPKWLQVDFSSHVQTFAETVAGEVSAEVLREVFFSTYAKVATAAHVEKYVSSRREGREYLSVRMSDGASQLKSNPPAFEVSGEGHGVLDAFVQGLTAKTGKKIVLVNYEEHTLGNDQGAEAIAYVQLNCEGTRSCGVAKSRDIIEASLQAIENAFSRATNCL